MASNACNNRGKKEAAEERKVRAFEMRKEARSYRDIARELGCNEATAFNDVKEVLLRHQAQSDKLAGQYVELEDQRLGMVISALARKVQQGDVAACATFIRALESRRKLLGIDAPDVVKLIKDYAELSNEELLAIANGSTVYPRPESGGIQDQPTVN